MSTVLINPFEVASGTSNEQFLADWEVAAAYMRRQPGFLGSRLHRALRPDARFRFVNVAEWASPAAFQDAVSTDEFRSIASTGPFGSPALYEVVRTVEAEQTPLPLGDGPVGTDEPLPAPPPSDPLTTHGDGHVSGPADRPTNFVAGVMHDRAQFDRALEELSALGIERSSLGVLYGQAGADAIGQRERHWFRDLLGDETRYVDRYEEEIRMGGMVVGVPIDPRRDRERENVMSILRTHGAHFLVSGTRWTYTVEE